MDRKREKHRANETRTSLRSSGTPDVSKIQSGVVDSRSASFSSEEQDIQSSGSELECESGSECMSYVDPETKRRMPLTTKPIHKPLASFSSVPKCASLMPVEIAWPRRLLTAHNGLGDARSINVDDEHYYMIVDVETSGPVWGVNGILAAAIAVVRVVMRHGHWEVRIMDLRLFSYPQDMVIFEPGIRDPGGFWYRHSDVLELLKRTAHEHRMEPEHVTREMMRWWDEAMIRFNYPHIWSDNPVFDIGWLSFVVGQHLKRPGLSYVRHPHILDQFIYARPGHHVNSVCMDLIKPALLHMIDYCGAPSLMNLALKHQSLGVLVPLPYDHNPANDAQRVALNFGRLLCRWIERRLFTSSGHRVRLDIVCYAFEREEPLSVKPSRSTARVATATVVEHVSILSKSATTVATVESSTVGSSSSFTSSKIQLPPLTNETAEICPRPRSLSANSVTPVKKPRVKKK